MKRGSSLFSALLLAASVACQHAESAPPAPAPPVAALPESARPGVIQQELALLEREYGLNDTRRCTRSATEVVDIQHRCSETRWADCFYAGTMYWLGCGVAHAPSEAEKLYRRACDYGSMLGCTTLSVFITDVERSIALLEKPCAQGYAYACGSLGARLSAREKPDIARATDLLEGACRSDCQFCGVLGAMVHQWKLEPRFAATRTLLEHACEAKDADSCYVLAQALEDGNLGTPVDYERAATLSSATCHELSHLPSCNSLGYMLVRGRGGEKNPDRGAWYFKEACKRDYGPACDSMGEALEKGWGWPVNPSSALGYYDRGCELANEHACQRARELRAAGVEAAERKGN